MAGDAVLAPGLLALLAAQVPTGTATSASPRAEPMTIERTDLVLIRSVMVISAFLLLPAISRPPLCEPSPTPPMKPS